MSKIVQPLVLHQQRRSIFVTNQLFVRGPFPKETRTPEDRNRVILNRFKNRRLELASPAGQPLQWKIDPPQKETKIVPQRERKFLPQHETAPPYEIYTEERRKEIESMGTYYDPLFNPHLQERYHEVNPDEEPFNAIYTDSQSEMASQYTEVRNITTPELWQYVERLARIKVAPEIKRRAPNEPLYKLPSGLVPPPQCPPDLPYFVARTRNHLLPVYYNLHSDPEMCQTMVKMVTGDLWKLEEDLRIHLENLNGNKKRILSSVQETDEVVSFRGKHLHQIVDWLYEKGF